MFHDDDQSNDDFLAQISITTLLALRHCFEWLQHCFINIPKLCCAKNCPYESSRVALPLEQITKSKGLRDFSQ